MFSVEGDALEKLQGLHRDLSALEQNSLNNIDRLVEELADRIDEYRGLLDKKGKNEASLQSLRSGKHWHRAVFRRQTLISRL